MTRRSVRALCVMAACLLGPAALCMAQATLPPELVQAQSIGPAQADQIHQYVQTPLQNLGSDDNDAVKEARNTLLAPLRVPNVGVSFRQEYSKQCLPRLTELTKGTRDQVASNALRVVGELATSEAVELLGQKLGDKKSDSVRYFATAECARVFEVVDTNQPALLPGDLRTMADKLGDAVLNEAHPDALHAAVRALVRGSKLTRDGFESVRKGSLAVLCKQCIARSKTPNAWAVGSQALPALLQAQSDLREMLGQANPRLALQQDEVRAVVALQARMIVWMSENVREIQAGTPARQVAEQSVRVGETACVVGLDKLGARYESQRMAEDFKAGDDKKFFDKASQLRRQLEAPPLNFEPLGKP